MLPGVVGTYSTEEQLKEVINALVIYKSHIEANCIIRPSLFHSAWDAYFSDKLFIG